MEKIEGKVSTTLTDGGLSIDTIKKYICPLASDREAYFFLQLCKAQGLNPFLREAYLIKYNENEPASIVTGKETFTKRADKLAVFDGFEAGIVVLDKTGQIIYREGALLIKGETLLGGWAKVYRKDRSHPYRTEVSIEEYFRYTKSGEPMRNWQAMPATMIRKVALVQALREAFPTEFGGLYSPEEMPVDDSRLPEYKIGVNDNGEEAQKEERPPVTPTPELQKPIQQQQAENTHQSRLMTNRQAEAIKKIAAKGGIDPDTVEEAIKGLTVGQASNLIQSMQKKDFSFFSGVPEEVTAEEEF